MDKWAEIANEWFTHDGSMGSFYWHLCKAITVADRANTERLRKAFPELVAYIKGEKDLPKARRGLAFAVGGRILPPVIRFLTCPTSERSAELVLAAPLTPECGFGAPQSLAERVI